MEDRELIREIHRGKKEYLNVIAQKYYDDIYRFCCYQTGNKEQSYDLAQETFLRFIRYVDSYHYQNLKGYLLTIARNVCIDYFRSQGSRPQFAELPDEMEETKRGGVAGDREAVIAKNLEKGGFLWIIRFSWRTSQWMNRKSNNLWSEFVPQWRHKSRSIH